MIQPYWARDDQALRLPVELRIDIGEPACPGDRVAHAHIAFIHTIYPGQMVVIVLVEQVFDATAQSPAAV